MKIGGREIKSMSEEVLVLPRLSDEDIVIVARAVKSMDEFEAICPEPKAPGVRTKDGFRPDEKDEGYVALMDQHAEQRLAFIVIKSLEASDIEWESVSIDDPGTWKNWRPNFEEAGLSAIEVGRIVTCVMRANSLNETKLEEAREAFLLGRAQ
jgi:hypothetical protein